MKDQRTIKPNVLVAGFPKCGSTYLYHILKQHPDIFIPKIKELNYFNKDSFFLGHPEVLNPRYFKSTEWYFDFFKEAREKVVIDFSILTSYDKLAAQRAKDLLGDIKIIFIKKDRMKFLDSAYSFVKAEGGQLTSRISEYSWFDVSINQYRNIFSNVFVIDLERLNSSPKSVLVDLLEFLDLDDYEFKLEVPRHKGREYKMKYSSYVKRQFYVSLVNSFYRLLSKTVTAKIKAQGEND